MLWAVLYFMLCTKKKLLKGIENVKETDMLVTLKVAYGCGQCCTFCCVQENKIIRELSIRQIN